MANALRFQRMRTLRVESTAPTHGASVRAPRVRVAFVNNYPMDRCREWWEQGQIPGHLCWGGPQLERLGFDVAYVRNARFGGLSRLARSRLEYVEQQLRILLKRRLDVVYSGHFVNTMLLSSLRRRRLLRVPVVCVVFMEIPPVIGEQAVAGGLGYDAYIALSPSLRSHLIDQLGISEERVHVIPWGADLDFYGDCHPPADRGRQLVVSAGKTDRDFVTLVRAAEQIDAEVRIYSDGGSVSAELPRAPNVEVRTAEPGRFSVPYNELLSALRQASVVAIPSREVSHMVGQTSLFEAMALGRPVVMTRTRHVPFDIEAEGVGLWVDSGDAEGFAVALGRLLARRDEAEAMGARARRLCEARYNIDRYARDVAQILRIVAGRGA